MLIWGHSDEDHNRCLIRCLEKAQKTGMILNVDKYKFKETELIYFGQKLTKNDMEAEENKVKGTLELQKHEDRKVVQRLLGLINYVKKFIPNLSKLTTPCRELLVKNKPYE